MHANRCGAADADGVHFFLKTKVSSWFPGSLDRERRSGVRWVTWIHSARLPRVRMTQQSESRD